MEHRLCCIGFGKVALEKGKIFLGKNYIIFDNNELKWLTHLKNTKL